MTLPTSSTTRPFGLAAYRSEMSSAERDLPPTAPARPEVFSHWRPRAELRRALRRVREWIGDYPVFLPVLLRATPKGTSRALSADTDLVVEGYPRSGNTFAVTALEFANPDVVIKSHVHFPAQVRAAVHRSLPTMICIRQPIDSVASLLIAFPHIRIGAALREYIHHHEEMLDVADQVLIAPFDEITTDLAPITAELNERWGLQLKPFSHSAADTEAVFDRIDERNRLDHGKEASERLFARPSATRQGEKQWILYQLGSPRFAKRLARAEAIYAELLGRSRSKRHT